MFGYLNTRDLTQYMDRSVVLYDGVPGYVRVDAADDGQSVVFYPLTNRNANKRIKITDDKFSCRNLDFGYCQFNTNAHFVSRNPLRMYKQGIVRDHLRITNSMPLAGIDITMTKEFASCILGKHMTFRAAMKQVDTDERESSSYAFDRNFCVAKFDGDNIVIKYMNQTVALNHKGKWSIKHDTPFKDRMVKLIKDAGGPDVEA